MEHLNKWAEENPGEKVRLISICKRHEPQPTLSLDHRCLPVDRGTEARLELPD
jgi:hypothetical protein